MSCSVLFSLIGNLRDGVHGVPYMLRLHPSQLPTLSQVRGATFDDLVLLKFRPSHGKLEERKAGSREDQTRAINLGEPFRPKRCDVYAPRQKTLLTHSGVKNNNTLNRTQHYSLCDQFPFIVSPGVHVPSLYPNITPSALVNHKFIYT